MPSKKIILFKSVLFTDRSTEQWALEVLNNDYYDNFPQYINKEEIENAFDDYAYKLNPFNSQIYADSIARSPNIEGYFFAQNLPEIESVVVDEFCSKRVVNKTLEQHDDATHIGFSIYALGMDKALEMINYISTNYPSKELILGNVGVKYPHINKLIKSKTIKKENVCYGNGVNWLRIRLGLHPIKPQEITVPVIKSKIYGLPLQVNSEYLVTQIGCPNSCDFCITHAFLNYNPFCANPKKIINHFERIRSSYDNDIFLFVCDPNAFFPERTWKYIFDYFSKEEVLRKSENLIHLLVLSSLAHMKKFNIQKIQDKSAIKIMMANYGIESVLQGGYKKNLGVTNEFVKKMKSIGIIPHQNFILGLPLHDKKNIFLDMQRNMEYDAAWFSINTYKPLAGTFLYEELKKKGQLFGMDLPPELLYRDGFLPFSHNKIGGGFSILKYAFESYCQCEKKIGNAYLNFYDILSNSPAFEKSIVLQELANALRKLGMDNKVIYNARAAKSMIN